MKFFAAAVLCVGLSFCGIAAGQQVSASAADLQRAERQRDQIARETQLRIDPDVPPGRRALVDYGGYLTAGYLSLDDSTHDNHAFRIYEMVGYGRVNLDGANEFYARGRATYRNFNTGDNFEGSTDQVEGRLEEAWYRFDLQHYVAAYDGRATNDDVWIKGGRQFVDWGNGLTLDQYVDGLSAQLSTPALAVDLLVGVTVRETIDFDTSRPNFDTDTRRGFFGGRVTATIGRQRPFAYLLGQCDFNGSESQTSHIIPTRYDYNSYYAGIGCNGAISDVLAYGVEFCFEGGRGLSNSFDPQSQQPVSQKSQTIEAYAADFRREYVPNDARRSRLGAEAILASGDKDRQNTSTTFGGNQRGTVDRAFNSLGVIDTGLAFTPPVSNLLALRLGASTFPFAGSKRFNGLQIGTNVYGFCKLEADAPIDETTTHQTYLGWEPDAFVNWQITDDLILTARYGVFFPGDAIPSGDASRNRQFVYLAVTYAI